MCWSLLLQPSRLLSLPHSYKPRRMGFFRDSQCPTSWITEFFRLKKPLKMIESKGSKPKESKVKTRESPVTEQHEGLGLFLQSRAANPTREQFPPHGQTANPTAAPGLPLEAVGGTWTRPRAWVSSGGCTGKTPQAPPALLTDSRAEISAQGRNPSPGQPQPVRTKPPTQGEAELQPQALQPPLPCFKSSGNPTGISCPWIIPIPGLGAELGGSHPLFAASRALGSWSCPCRIPEVGRQLLLEFGMSSPILSP